MQKCLKSWIFIGFIIFTSDLLAHTKNIWQCVEPLQFNLPEPLKKVGVSNIKVRNGSNNHSASTDEFNLYEFYFHIGGQPYEIEVAIEKLEHFAFSFSRIEEGLERLNAMRNGDLVSDQVVLERLRQVLGELPIGLFQKKFSLVINRGQYMKKNKIVNGAVLWGKRIDLYSPLGLFTKDYLSIHTFETMAHELGHVIDIESHHPFQTQAYYSISHSQRWKDAISADGHSVSEYGDEEGYHEDFAEAMMFYVWSHGGLYHADFLDKFPNRFAILDEVMGVDSIQRRRINEETYSQQREDRFPHILNQILPRINQIINEHSRTASE